MGPWVCFIASTVLYLMEVDVFRITIFYLSMAEAGKGHKKSSIDGVMRFDAPFASISLNYRGLVAKSWVRLDDL